MVQVDLPLSAAVGATLAAAARVQLRGEQRLFQNGYLGSAVAFGGFFLLPALLFFLGSWPAWDTMYWFDRATLPGWFLAGIAALFLAAFALGFVAVHALIQRGAERWALALPALFCLPTLVIVVAFHDRFLHVGTRASFAAGAPPNLFTSDVLWGLCLVIPLWVGLPLALLVWRWVQPSLAELRAARPG